VPDMSWHVLHRHGHRTVERPALPASHLVRGVAFGAVGVSPCWGSHPKSANPSALWWRGAMPPVQVAEMRRPPTQAASVDKITSIFLLLPFFGE
jgi:hypothetical protein